MNIDCTLIIFEQLSFDDLLNMALVNRNCGYLASDVFRRRFGQKPLKIAGDSPGSGFTDFKYELMITDLPLLQKIFRSFGGSIEKMEIDLENIRKTHHKSLLEDVNIFCYKSLIELKVHKCHGNLFSRWNKPFEKLEKVQLFGELDTLQSKTLQINELFPVVRHFDGFVKIGDLQSIDRHLEHLEHLSLTFTAEEPHFVSLLKKNPQIKSIQTYMNSETTLRLVSKHLPQLEKIDFNLFPDSEAHFENVKEAKIISRAIVSPAKISLESLQKLDLTMDKCQLPDIWLDFIANMKELRNFKLNMGFFTNAQLSKLTDMRSLTEVNIECAQDVSVEAIVRFLQTNKQLKTVYLRKLPKSTHPTLRQRLTEWKVISYVSNVSSDAYFVKPIKKVR